MAKVRIRHRLYEGLVYGPNSEIQFGVRGGFAPGECVVDDEDPLAQQLLADPDVSVVTDSGPEMIYVCSEDGAEFKTKSSLAGHIRAKHSKKKEAAEGDDPKA